MIFSYIQILLNSSNFILADFKKAFNSIDHSFLFAVLDRLDLAQVLFSR